MPTVLVLLYSVVSEDCLDEKEALVIFDQAVQLEESGSFKEAYLKYKIVDVTVCENFKVRGKAFNRVVAVKEVINAQ